MLPTHQDTADATNFLTFTAGSGLRKEEEVGWPKIRLDLWAVWAEGDGLLALGGILPRLVVLLGTTQCESTLGR